MSNNLGIGGGLNLGLNNTLGSSNNNNTGMNTNLNTGNLNNTGNSGSLGLNLNQGTTGTGLNLGGGNSGLNIQSGGGLNLGLNNNTNNTTNNNNTNSNNNLGGGLLSLGNTSNMNTGIGTGLGIGSGNNIGTNLGTGGLKINTGNNASGLNLGGGNNNNNLSLGLNNQTNNSSGLTGSGGNSLGLGLNLPKTGGLGTGLGTGTVTGGSGLTLGNSNNNISNSVNSENNPNISNTNNNKIKENVNLSNMTNINKPVYSIDVLHKLFKTLSMSNIDNKIEKLEMKNIEDPVFKQMYENINKSKLNTKSLEKPKYKLDIIMQKYNNNISNNSINLYKKRYIAEEQPLLDHNLKNHSNKVNINSSIINTKKNNVLSSFKNNNGYFLASDLFENLAMQDNQGSINFENKEVENERQLSNFNHISSNYKIKNETNEDSYANRIILKAEKSRITLEKNDKINYSDFEFYFNNLSKYFIYSLTSFKDGSLGILKEENDIIPRHKFFSLLCSQCSKNSFSETKQNLFSFLEFLINNLSYKGHNVDQKVSRYFNLSIKYIENKFYGNVLNKYQKYLERNVSSNKDKLILIENYVEDIIAKNEYLKSCKMKRSELLSWGMIFFSLKAGISLSSIKDHLTLNSTISIDNLILAQNIKDFKENEISAYNKIIERLEEIKNSSLQNPYEIAVLNIISKINIPLDTKFFLNMEESLWYYLNTVNDKTNLMITKFENSLTKSYLSNNTIKLQNFQEFMIENYNNLLKNGEDEYETVYLFFCSGLIEIVLEKVYNTTKNILDLYMISMILYESNILANLHFDETDNNINEFVETQSSKSSAIYIKYLQSFVNIYFNNFKNIGNILLFTISNNINALNNGFEEVERLNLKTDIPFNKSVNAYEFTKNYPNFVYKELVLKILSHYSSENILINTNYVIYETEFANKTGFLSNFINQSIKVKICLSNIVGNGQFLDTLITRILKDNQINYNFSTSLLDLALNCRKYEDLLNLLIKASITSLKNNYPEIQNTHAFNNKSDFNNKNKISVSELSDYISFIGNSLSSRKLDQKFRNSYEWLLNLHIVENIFLNLNSLNTSNNAHLVLNNCYKMFVFDLEIFPFNKNELLNMFVGKLQSLDEYILEFIPDIIRVFLYVAKEKSIFIVESGLINTNSE